MTEDLFDDADREELMDSFESALHEQSANIDLDFKLDDDTLTLGETWESIANIASARYEDNKLCESSYPLEIRTLQANTLNHLIKHLLKLHDALEKSKSQEAV